MNKLIFGIIGAFAVGLGGIYLNKLKKFHIPIKFKYDIGTKLHGTAKKWFDEAVKAGYRNNIYSIKNDIVYLKRDVQNKAIIIGLIGMIKERKQLFEEIKDVVMTELVKIEDVNE